MKEVKLNGNRQYNKMEAVLKNYKKIIGDDKCSMNQADFNMLERVTGKMSYIDQIEFLLTIIGHVENNDIYTELYKQSYEEIKNEKDKLVEKVKSMESLIGTYNKYYLQRGKVRTGENKISHRLPITLEDINKIERKKLEYQIKKLERS